MKCQGTLLAVVGLFLWAVFIPALQASTIVKRMPGRHYYTLHVPKMLNAPLSPEAAACHVAEAMGLQFEGQVGELQTYYWVSVADDSATLEKREAPDRDAILDLFEHHKANHLQKKGLDSHAWTMVQRIDPQIPKKRIKRAIIPNLYTREPPFSEANQGSVEVAMAQKTLKINDPGFDRQWHLINQDIYRNDINVTGVWLQGIAGNGTVVAILDDGLDFESRDLAENFFAEGSYDFNDHTELPRPRLYDDNHGTRCAGQIAALKNDLCGVGIAYQAKVAGVRILSAEITDADEAAALNYKFQENDIFSCSWGPADDGKTMEAPTGILADAFVNGIEKGRGGKGTIYVFATGNGAMYGDNCNFDGYTNSIYTITVGAVDYTNAHPPYAESCSAQMVVTYSSGSGKYIFTTDRGVDSCTERHGGTSAAAPSAAGIFALVLSVRPDLTWRDLQHLCVQTAVPVNLEDSDWKKLPSGRTYNHKYGYGRLDAYAIVEAAKSFTNVNPQTHVVLPVEMSSMAIPDSSSGKKTPLKSKVTVTKEMIQGAGMLRLEHVTATVNISHKRRGDIVITLVSPNKVESELATARQDDQSQDGIRDWKFMSVKHWEEDPVGDWTLLIYDVSHPEANGTLDNWTLTLFGELDPAFKGDPVYNPGTGHDLAVVPQSSSDVSSSTETSTSTTSSQTTQSTEPKQSPAASTHSSSTPATSSGGVVPAGEVGESAEGEEESHDSGGSSIVYALVGSATLLTLATGVYFKKRHSWRSPEPGSSPNPVGHEFSVLGNSEAEGDHDEDSDNRPLLSSQENRNSD